MSTKIFISLPVRDLARATAFYEAVGATKTPHFSDATASAMAFSEEIVVMLLTHDRFAQFSPKPIADRGTTQVLLCYSVESRTAVDQTIKKAGAAGGKMDPSPADDHGFMYGRSFEDLDGHLWQAMWMDVDAMAGGGSAP